MLGQEKVVKLCLVADAMSEDVGLSDAPLATFEIDEFCEEFSEFQDCMKGGASVGAKSAAASTTASSSGLDNGVDNVTEGAGASSSTSTSSPSSASSSSGVDNQTTATSGTTMVDNFNENFSGSLEDLVSTFDEKITKCFCNFNETTEKIAPVQVIIAQWRRNG